MESQTEILDATHPKLAPFQAAVRAALLSRIAAEEANIAAAKKKRAADVAKAKDAAKRLLGAQKILKVLH